jgi:hypothetical protein
MEIRLNYSRRAGVPAFRAQKSAFYGFVCLVLWQRIDRVSQDRSLTVSVSHGGLF